jgi:hypothetical protein
LVGDWFRLDGSRRGFGRLLYVSYDRMELTYICLQTLQVFFIILEIGIFVFDLSYSRFLALDRFLGNRDRCPKPNIPPLTPDVDGGGTRVIPLRSFPSTHRPPHETHILLPSLLPSFFLGYPTNGIPRQDELGQLSPSNE